MTTSRGEVKTPTLKYESVEVQGITLHWHTGGSTDVAWRKDGFKEIRVYWLEDKLLIVDYVRDSGLVKDKNIYPASSIFSVGVEYP
jgi:hypothetical protein